MEKRKVLSLLLTLAVLVGIISYIPCDNVKAVTTTCDSYDGTNIESQNYDRWANVVDSYLEVTAGGNLMRVQNTANDGVAVEYYDKDFNFVLSKSIPEELPIFGGFYASDTNYFLVTGQTNYSQSADVEVVRITKYNKSWKRLSSVGLYDCNTTVPFDAGSCRMDMLGKYLIIRTCHEMYKSDDGYNHQSNMTIQVDTENMIISDSYSGVMNTGWGYASHSFNQFIKMDGNNIVAVDHGDAYPRSIALFKYVTDASTGKFVPTYNTQCKVVDVINIPGAVGENATNATIGGFGMSSVSYLITGNSVVQDDNNLSRSTRNIYVASVDRTDLSVDINWITSIKEGETSTRTPQLMQISENRFLLLWSVDDTVYFTRLYGNGTKCGETYSIKGHLSDCVPVKYNNYAVWYTWDDGQVTFYKINTKDLSDNGKIVLNNGHTFDDIRVNNGVSTLTCSICGTVEEMAVPTNMSIWWNTAEQYGGYTSVFPKNGTIGGHIHCWITYDPSGVNKNFEITSDNPGIVRIDEVGDLMYKLTAVGAGHTVIRVKHKYNPNLSKSYNLYINHDVAVEINGYQISSTNKGIRSIYSVSDPNSKVAEVGLIYGLKDYSIISDMVVDSEDKMIYSCKATSAGVSNKLYTSMTNANSYIITMKFGECSPAFFTADTMIRAYAKLDDGNYVYSDIYEYNVYNVADLLYKNNYMNNKTSHNYLYTDILSKVNQNYSKVTYKQGDSLVEP